MNLAIIKLAWQQFCQQYHSADSRLLRWTQFLLVLFLLTLSMTTSSIKHYLDTNLQQLLGADMVISQYEPISASHKKFLHSQSDTMSVSRLINITLTNKTLWQKVQLKVVDEFYPIQGSLKTSTELSINGETTAFGPQQGELWVDLRLYKSLNLDIGQSLILGGQTFIVKRIIHHEPDRIMEGHSVAMRAMINQIDLARIQIEKNKTKYRYLLNANEQQITGLLSWVKSTLPAAKSMHKKGNHPLASFWQRVENFIGLASVLLFLMAAIAIDQAGRRQLLNQKRFIAVCMSMGLSQFSSIYMSFIQWLISFILLLLPAILLSYVLQFFAIEQMQQTFEGLAANWQLLPVLKTLAVLFLLLLTFQIPQWVEIYQVSVAGLIRQKLDQRNVIYRIAFSVISIGLLTIVYSDNALLTGLILGSLALTVFLLMGLTWLVLTVAQKVTQGATGLIPFSFFMMKQRLLSKTMQILGVGLCATLLLFTLSLMKDLGQTMSKYMRTHDGNLIISQAQKSHINALKVWSEKSNSVIKQLKPFTYSQLVKVNGKSLAEHSDKPSDSMATLQKPVRLHWTNKIPKNNQLISGKWWQSKPTNWHQISVEEEIMTDMNLNLGDTLRFIILNQSYQFTITASHEFKAGKGTMTFWFQIPSTAREHIEANTLYMGSMELTDEAWSGLSSLWQQYPALRLTSVKEITHRFDQTLTMIIKLVSVFSIMIILFALLVIAASVQGYEADEKIKNGLLLSFGQSKLMCLKLSVFEWCITGIIASSGAVFGTWIAGVLIYKSQFSLTYTPDIIWIISTLLSTVFIVCIAGLMNNKNNLNVSIKRLLA
ncbi:ABC transporter permease [Pseudoalteromonas denitrificans]|uniref:Predicted ABC-type transport system involved in lysophospholipase L1 biosynthesis, permease component n=1 Tax=Pseudoalteromonas denitrificans DSM 6059 TaxID=1123010 RepID=A0A1I1N2U7_9GAMM|nr:FtsX-like permease family protein [Pseudoalteromonas denitrificans]SFC91957.1 Predicted ABC-type transport system involved in lysophospholipase L1 biosynthesis, permease component [Pseudoalteromonas denitrificans DSM 6059]